MPRRWKIPGGDARGADRACRPVLAGDERARAGRAAGPVDHARAIGGRRARVYQWSELRRVAPVLVMPRPPLAKLKKIRRRVAGPAADWPGPGELSRLRALCAGPAQALRDHPAVHRPESTTHLHAVPRLEATAPRRSWPTAAASLMPDARRAAVFPALAEGTVQLGLPAVRPNPHAETSAPAARGAGRLK